MMQGSNGLEKQNGNTSQTNDVSEDLRDLVIILSPFTHGLKIFRIIPVITSKLRIFAQWSNKNVAIYYLETQPSNQLDLK